MDDATRLIGDLQLKLAQLDDKVSAYRQDMAAEFRRYSRQVLQHLPQDISTEVERRVAESFAQYPALGPDLQRQADSQPPPALDDSLSSSPSQHHHHHRRRRDDHQDHHQHGHSDSNWPPRPESGAPSPSEPEHSPLAEPTPTTPTRDRDAQLEGVFTPTYLPLFDGAKGAAPQSPGMGGSSEDSKRDSVKAISAAAATANASSSLTPPRPFHERRPTNETTSSGGSDHTESKVPRSAMRRTSSGPKPPPSPRRVRFEFEGGEVLPTSSPQNSEVSLVQSHSLHSSGLPPNLETGGLGEDEPSVESLLGPDEDSTPPPKKVSSSQALRALSRTPLDADTIWTVVNAESPDPSDRDSPRNLASPSPSRTSSAESPLKTSAVASGLPRVLVQQQHHKKMLKSPPPEPQMELNDEEEGDGDRDDDDDDDDSSSDDDFLAMAKPKGFANKKALMSPLSRSPPRAVVSPPAPTSSQASQDRSKSQDGPQTPTKAPSRQHVADEYDEDMFHFEGGPPSKTRPMPAPIEDDEEDVEDAGPESTTHDGPTLYSTSPAVTVPKSEAPPSTQMASGTVGSFKGRSVHMPVVKDPEVYAQAASLGGISSFIGGVDGRSGADEGDLASYRASVGQVLFSGTPRSLTERMMMEDAQAQRRAAAEGQ